MRETLGYLPQSFGFHPRVSAERLLDHFAVLKGVVEPGPRRDVVESLLRRTNLWEVRKQRVGTFSGGMRQRLGVAVALLGNPKLIIVDEPTAGLDPEERVRFLNLLSEIGEDSVVILSTHIVEDVEELCSRMAIIDRGEILLEAEPIARDRRAAGADLAPDREPGRAAGARADAAGDLHQAAGGADDRARLRRVVAGRGVRAGRAGHEGRVLQRHGGAHRRGPRWPSGGRRRESFAKSSDTSSSTAFAAASTWAYAAFLFLIMSWGLVAADGGDAVNANAPQRRRPGHRAVRRTVRAAGLGGALRRCGDPRRRGRHGSAPLHHAAPQGRVPRRPFPRGAGDQRRSSCSRSRSGSGSPR